MKESIIGLDGFGAGTNTSSCSEQVDGGVRLLMPSFGKKSSYEKERRCYANRN
jgi:hypothetical protein